MADGLDHGMGQGELEIIFGADGLAGDVKQLQAILHNMAVNFGVLLGALAESPAVMFLDPDLLLFLVKQAAMAHSIVCPKDGEARVRARGARTPMGLTEGDQEWLRKLLDTTTW